MEDVDSGVICNELFMLPNRILEQIKKRGSRFFRAGWKPAVRIAGILPVSGQLTLFLSTLNIGTANIRYSGSEKNNRFV